MSGKPWWEAKTIRVAILTVSDRSSAGQREDLSGPALERSIREQGWALAKQVVIPDSREQIRSLLTSWADSGEIDVILTTGGTGFAPRDVTPEATLDVLDRSAPGIVEAMRAASLQLTPHAMLSRAVSGIRGRTVIINLPGSPKGALETLEVVLPVLPHAVELLREDPGAEASHRTHG